MVIFNNALFAAYMLALFMLWVDKKYPKGKK